MFLIFKTVINFKMVLTGLRWRRCSLCFSKGLPLKTCSQVFSDENRTMGCKGKGIDLFYIRCWFEDQLTCSLCKTWRPELLWQSAAEYVVRVSFGTALIASIVIVYTTIIALISSRRYLISLVVQIVAISCCVSYISLTN